MNALEHRIPPPIVMLLTGLAMWQFARLLPRVEVDDTLRLVLAGMFLIDGVFCCLAGVYCFRKAQTTVDPLHPDKASRLVTGGIYQVSRNPMYLGFAILLLAWAVYLASPWMLLGVPAFMLYIRRFQIAPEERALSALFGSEFADYCARVRRWL
jgi:protein-S-isoprenylcysteine O-methyltransferase Ste14